MSDMQTASKQTAVSSPENPMATRNIWSQDAIRISEQIKRKLTDRPAVILIGGLENSRSAATVAFETSQAMAVLTGDPVLLLDWDPSSSGLENLAHAVFPDLAAPTPVKSVLEKSSSSQLTATKLQENFFYSYFERQSADGADGSLISPECLEQLEELRALFPLTVLHSTAFSVQESYALLSRADFIVVVVTREESGFANLEKFYLNCQTITDKPLAAVLADNVDDAS